MATTLKRSFWVLFLTLTVGLTPGVTYPLFSYFTSLRDAFTSRISDVSEEEIALLEQHDDPMAQMEAARLRTTYADVAEPFVSISFNDIIGGYVHTPFNYMGCTTGFSALYRWFSKKMKYTQLIPTIVKGILSGAVIFAITEVVSKKLYPNWVNKNYYTRTVASRLCAQFAIACGVCLLGSQSDDQARTTHT